MKSTQNKKEHYQHLVKEQATSKLSVAAYCRRHKIKAPTFWYWRKKLSQEKKPSEPSKPGFIPIRQSKPLYFQNSSQSERIEINHPSGISIKLPASYDFEKIWNFLGQGEF
jgi:transposase-like protein